MFGKYELVERLGQGGMAEVWKAKIRGIAGFERTLVIKRILPQLVRDEEFVAMFVREAQLCSMLSHTNIVQVFELGELEGEYYLAMEYVRGRDLHAVMRARPKEPPPPGLAATVGRDICRALGYAHALKDGNGQPLRLIHRDVTPSNVMLSFDGSIKLVDFGVAKALSMASASITSAGSIKGKLSYMSPEQITGGEVDHRTDLFAVAITIHEALTGRRLFKGEDDEETVEKVLAAEVFAPSKLNPAVPRELDRVLLRALERDPEDRFQTGDELADALEACVHQLKWGPAQVSALMRERCPEGSSEAVPPSRPIAVSAPVQVVSIFQATVSAAATLPDAPPPKPSFVNAPTEFAGSSEPTHSTTDHDARHYRPTLHMVRVADEMGAWTAEDALVTPQPLPLPLPPAPSSAAARSLDEQPTIPMTPLAKSPPRGVPAPRAQTAAPLPQTVVNAAALPQTVMNAAPLPQMATVASARIRVTPQPTTGAQRTIALPMLPLGAEVSSSGTDVIPRKPMALRIALSGSVALLVLSAILFYVHSDAPKVEGIGAQPGAVPVLPAVAAPVEAAKSVPAAAIAPMKVPAKPADEMTLLYPSSAGGDDRASRGTHGAHSHRTRSPRASDGDKPAKQPSKQDGARTPNDELERGGLVNPF